MRAGRRRYAQALWVAVWRLGWICLREVSRAGRRAGVTRVVEWATGRGVKVLI